MLCQSEPDFTGFSANNRQFPANDRGGACGPQADILYT
jgi:hypothetical protein